MPLSECELLKPLGRVIQVQKNKLIVQIECDLPKIGKDIFDDKENFVGAVTDFFGQTKKPHVVISTKHSAERYRGKDLFY